ncbi:MAG: hypothetical protein FWG02_02590 [Holophagaceae bacterium]|nr:hypothetical protein [Holophagaceae bacterium]
MDQSEIDAIMGGGSGKGSGSKKHKGAQPAPKPPETTAPAPVPAPTPVATPPPASAKKDSEVSSSIPSVRVIGELGAVTAVTERETNKVMDKLDQISQLLDQQRILVTEMMGNESIQNPTIQSSVHQIMTACTEIQNKVYEAMDLMQFQDISRQKLERIMHHLRQIHDYILDLLGTGFQSQPAAKISLSNSIASTGTSPDENKTHADSVVDEFLRANKKG